MGYTTRFNGYVTVNPPLSAGEVAFLKAYAATRHCQHQVGPYDAPAGHGCRGFSCFNAAAGVPDLWCQWVPSDDGTQVKWDGGEKFYYYTEWMKYLIHHFLMPGAKCHDAVPAVATNPGTAVIRASEAEWTHREMNPAGHVLNGVISWQGEEPDDMGRIVVKDNVVMVQEATRSYGGYEEV